MINFIYKFTLYSMVMSVFIKTVYGLISSINDAFFITDEEVEISYNEMEEDEKELDELLSEIEWLSSGLKDVIYRYLEWYSEHEIISIFISYIVCFIPIINIVVSFSDIENIYYVVVTKIEVYSNRKS